jgi:glycosyltransferase involved in cell wall biosynthesis
MQQPKVSIGIVSYNQRDYIAEAVESALAQDYENLEVIVSDDASTDGTADVIRSLCAKHPKLIAILNDENAGVTGNCNRVLRRCAGEFYSLMGGDDALLPGKIAAQVRWFSQSRGRVLCAHAVEHVDAQGRRLPDAPPPLIRGGQGPEQFIRGGFVVPGQSLMVRTSAIPKHGYDESIRLASDLLFAIEVLCNSGEFGYLDGRYYKYRHLTNSVSTRYFEMLSDIERIYDVVRDRYPQYRGICEEACLRNVTYFGGVRHLNSGNKKAAREQFLRTIRNRPLYVKAWVRLLQTL